jgi:hypothetical protein
MSSNTDAEKFIDLHLTDEIKKQEIVVSFKKDKRNNLLFLKLNHIYKQKQIISPVFEGSKWDETIDTLVKKLKRSGINDQHIELIEEILSNNFEAVSGLTEAAQGDNVNENSKRIKRVQIRKYTGNGTFPLQEAIVFRDGQTAFLSLGENGRPRYETEIDRPGLILHTADSLDTHNPLPYIFESPDELEQYLERARDETLDSLYFKTKAIYRKYVNIEEHYLTILSADTIYSYFQDKFATLHYNIFVGDNGSGKNSALLVYRHLGYRVFYVVSASAPNYFTFLGEIEECQGTIAEDEAEDIGYNKEKQKILKSGSASGGSVPKVDLNYSRTQASYLTYGMKWLAMEELPDYRKIKGILDRSFVFRFIVGNVDYNIKDVIKYAGDPKFKPLHDEIIDLRKLLFAFRMIRHPAVVPDLNLNIKHRSAELTKPLLRLFSSRKDAPTALEEIRRALSKVISERNELKRNSVESKLREVISNLIERGSNDLKLYTFYNEDIWAEAKTVMNGLDNGFKPASFYTVEFGSISHKFITSIYKSKFKAESFKVGSGNETKRGLRFSKEYLDRLAIYYDVPDEIIILDSKDKESATDATLAAHYKNGDLQIGPLNESNGMDIGSSDSVPSTLNAEPHTETEAVATRIDPIIEQNDKDVEYSKDDNSINVNEYELGTENNEKEEPSSFKCAASVASVADLHKTDSAEPASGKGLVVEVNLPLLPCLWCDYQNPIEFDLGTHFLERHKEELLKLPIGKCPMENRIEYAIQQIKRMMAAPIDKEDDDEDIAGENDLDEVE